MPAKKSTPARKRAGTVNRGGTTKIAALSVQRMSLDALKPHPRNPRKHPEEGSAEWQVLAASLKHDYFDPLVWNVRNGMLVSGHLRKKVLHSLGFTDADVVVVDYDEPTHVARLMAANKSVGEDDTAKMRELFSELSQMPNFDSSLAGFTSAELIAFCEITDQGTESPSTDEESRSSEALMSPQQVDQRIRYLLDALGAHTYPVTAGQTFVVGEGIVVLAAHEHLQLPQSLVRWISLDREQDRTLLGIARGSNAPCRVALGPDALTLVENGTRQLAPDARWVVVCPTITSASLLLSVYQAHHGARGRIRVVSN